jgi:hypothetical protein
MANGGRHHTKSLFEKVMRRSIISLATTVYNILQDDDYVQGTISHYSQKKKNAGRIITEHQFILQEQGSAEFPPLKMEAVGFYKGKNMGIQAHHNFVTNPEIVGYSVMARQIPYLCPGFCRGSKKLSLSTTPIHAMTVSIGAYTLAGAKLMN